MTGLREQVSLALGEPLATRVGALEEAALADVLSRGQDAWPSLSVAPAEFLAHAVTHASREPDLAHGLKELAAGDLYLAFAAARGASAAVRELETSFIEKLPAVLSRGADSNRADVLQQLRVRLLLGSESGSRPKLFDYAGRGPLAGWLRVAATRLSLDTVRRKKPDASSSTDEALLSLPAMIADPELELVRARHAGSFEQAFRDALAELPDEDRNLLRLRLVDDLSIDELAALFHVHRATAARWIIRTRETLETRTKELLESRLGLSPSELMSLVTIMRSHLDMSVGVLNVDD